MTIVDLSDRAAGRVLHLVDLDNLVGGPRHAERVEEMLDTFLDLAGFETGDHLVVGADASLARSAAFQVPRGTRFLVGRGPDGADQRLLEAATVQHIARRYGRLVVGSGDHRFEDLVRDVRALGVPVLVIGHEQSMARRLRLAADACRLMPCTQEPIHA